MYRIWDKEKKSFCNIFHYINNVGDVREYTTRGLNCPKQENYIVQQCTGLKDKNGVLIYEGDGLLYGEKIYEVVYKDYMFRLEGFYETHQDIPSDGFSEGFHNLCEIIGNIMEDN